MYRLRLCVIDETAAHKGSQLSAIGFQLQIPHLHCAAHFGGFGMTNACGLSLAFASRAECAHSARDAKAAQPLMVSVIPDIACAQYRLRSGIWASMQSGVHSVYSINLKRHNMMPLDSVKT